MELIYITCQDREEARKIVNHLLSKKLIVCGNYFEGDSIYSWKGKIEENKEVILFCKSPGGKFHNIKKEVEKIHSYDVPCILLLEAEGSEKYTKYAEGELR
jgi:periplasmic divalent cation tolerance protein